MHDKADAEFLGEDYVACVIQKHFFWLLKSMNLNFKYLLWQHASNHRLGKPLCVHLCPQANRNIVYLLLTSKTSVLLSVELGFLYISSKAKH